MTYLFWSMLYITSILAFQHTGILLVLSVAVIHLIIVIAVSAFGWGVMVSGHVDFSEEKPNTSKDIWFKLLLQMSILALGIQLFFIGYQFFAGMIFLQSIIRITSVVCEKIFSEEA